MDSEHARMAAGLMAALIVPEGESAADTIALANQFVPWIRRGNLRLSVSSWTYAQGSSERVPTRLTYEGDRPVATMKDNQQFTVTVAPEDAKDQMVGDTLTWSVDDDTVATLQPSDDTLSCLVVAGVPGTATYTYTDGTNSGTGTAVVVPGDVTQLAATESDPVDQPAAPVTGP